MRTDQAGGAVVARVGSGRPRDTLPARVRRSLLALCLMCALAPAPAQEVGVAARVDGVDITVFRLERHFEDYLRLQARNAAAIRHPEVFKRLKREALEQLIDKELLWQESQRRGMKIDDADVEQARQGIEAGFATREAYERRVREAGFDEAGYAEYLRRELAASRTLQALADVSEVGEEEVRHMLVQEPAPAGMPADEAKRRVREYLVASRRAESGRKALEQLRAAAKVELRQGF